MRGPRVPAYGDLSTQQHLLEQYKGIQMENGTGSSKWGPAVPALCAGTAGSSLRGPSNAEDVNGKTHLNKPVKKNEEKFTVGTTPLCRMQ